MPKVVILKQKLQGRGGGLERHTHALIKSYLNQNCEVFLVTAHPLPKGFQVPEGLRWLCTDTKYRWNYRHLSHYDEHSQRIVKRISPNICLGLERHSYQTHCRAGNGVHKAWLMLKTQAQGTLATFFDQLNPFHKLVCQIEKKAYENPSLKKLYTNSELVAQQVRYFYKVDTKKIRVIYNGVKWNENQEAFDEKLHFKPQIQKRLSMHSGCHQILFVGIGFKRKGLLHVLNSLRPIAKKQWQLHVVGTDTKQQYYQDYAQKYFSKEQVCFWGYRDNIVELYQACDTLILPTVYDPCANVVLEALSMGLQVITTDTNGAGELIEPSCGKVLPFTNMELWKEATRQYILKDPAHIATCDIRNSVKSLQWDQQIQELVKDSLNDL